MVLYRNVREVLRISFFRRRRAAARLIEHMGTIMIFLREGGLILTSSSECCGRGGSLETMVA